MDQSIILYDPQSHYGGICPAQPITYSYRVTAIDLTDKESVMSDRDSIFGYHDPCVFSEEGPDNLESENLTFKNELMQNYPNPFNPSTNLQFSVEDFSQVTIKVYDVLGKEIYTLVNEYKVPGIYSATFNGTNFSSGIYYYKIVIGQCQVHTAVIAKTTNSGETWFRSFTSPFKSRFRKIQFLDNNTGYAVGDTGLIVSTTNGGTNWIIQNSGTTKRLNGVAFLNKDTEFVVGDSGLILKTFTGGLVDITHQQEVIPSDFILYQNFPNQFNPVTNKKFDIINSGKVKVIIYDALGKEIKVILNEKLSPGSYSVEFDGSNFASGIYFYKIKAGDFEQVRKMMLLK